MSTDPSLAGQDKCVKPEAKKKKLKKQKTVEDYYLNLEPFRQKGSHKLLFETYNSLPIDSTAKGTLRFLHGCYFSGDRNEMSPYICSIRDQAGVKTRRGAQKIIERLVLAGFLIVEDQHDPRKAKVKQINNIYHFTKLMEKHQEIVVLKKRLKKRELHINGFHITSKLADSATEVQKNDFEKLSKLEKAYERMYSEIIKLPKRVSSVKSSILAKKRPKKTRENSLSPLEEKQLQKLLRKKKVKLESPKKKVEKQPKSSETLDNKYISFTPRTPVHGGGEREDTQTGKVNGKGTNQYNKPTEYVCNSSEDEIPLWTTQKDLIEIFNFYEKSFARTLDEDKKTEFQVRFLEYRLTKAEAITRLKIFKSDIFLSRTNTSIVRIFKIHGALKACELLKENIKKAHCQFSGRFREHVVGKDIGSFRSYQELIKYSNTPAPYLKPFKPGIQQQDSPQPESKRKSPTETPSSERIPLVKAEDTKMQINLSKKADVTERDKDKILLF